MAFHQITPLHSYLARLVPEGMRPEDVEQAAAMGALRELRLKAPSSTFAARSARHLTGLPVHSVERIEPLAVAA